MDLGVQAIRMFSLRQWVVVAPATMLAVAVLGLATGSIPNPVPFRQIPVTWWGYPLRATSAVLTGLLAGTYVNTGQPRRVENKATLGGVLSVFALGCPVRTNRFKGSRTATVAWGACPATFGSGWYRSALHQARVARRRSGRRVELVRTGPAGAGAGLGGPARGGVPPQAPSHGDVPGITGLRCGRG